MLKIRRSRDRLIFNMGIPIRGKSGLYIMRRDPGVIMEYFLSPFFTRLTLVISLCRWVTYGTSNGGAAVFSPPLQDAVQLP